MELIGRGRIVFVKLLDVETLEHVVRVLALDQLGGDRVENEPSVDSLARVRFESFSSSVSSL